MHAPAALHRVKHSGTNRTPAPALCLRASPHCGTSKAAPSGLPRRCTRPASLSPWNASSTRRRRWLSGCLVGRAAAPAAGPAATPQTHSYRMRTIHHIPTVCAPLTTAFAACCITSRLVLSTHSTGTCLHTTCLHTTCLSDLDLRITCCCTQLPSDAWAMLDLQHSPHAY